MVTNIVHIEDRQHKVLAIAIELAKSSIHGTGTDLRDADFIGFLRFANELVVWSERDAK